MSISSAATPEGILKSTEAAQATLKAASSSTPILASPSEITDYLTANDTKLVLFDCDGVIYRSKTPTSPTLIDTLSTLNKERKIAFVTNSSGKSRYQCLKLMESVTGLTNTFKPGQFFPAGYAAGEYLKANHPQVKKAYVIGGVGLVKSLEDVGISCIGGPVTPPPEGYTFHCDDVDIEAMPFDPEVTAVVIGMAKDFNYRMLSEATMYLTHKCGTFDGSKTVFISTNLDPFDVIGSESRRQPAAGCMVKAVEFSAKRESITVGKPSEALWSVISREVGGGEISPANVLMVGDRRDTDIRFGVRCGMKTAVVLSGCTPAEEILEMEKNGWSDGDKPDVIIPHVGLFYND